MIPEDPAHIGEIGGDDPDAKTTATRRAARTYERQCRHLLAAFPSEFRRNRGDDLVAALLDDAPGASRVSLRTAANLVATGTRMRARRAGADQGIRRSAVSGLDLAAVAGLGLQAALATASAVFFLEHRVIFYLYLQHTDYPGLAGYLSPDTVGHWIGADFPATWIALAAIWVVALAAAVRGHLRGAAVLSVLATAYPLAVLAVSLHAQSAISARISCYFSGPHLSHSSGLKVTSVMDVKSSPCSPAQIRALVFNTRYGQFVSTAAILAIAVVVTAVVIVTACRHRQGARRSWWWLATAGGLALIFVAVGDGHQLGSGYLTSGGAMPWSPSQAGVMTALGYLWVAGVVISLLWSWFDPRIGWAAAVLSVPFLVYQLTAPSFESPMPEPLWFHHRLLLAGAGVAIAMLATNAAATSWRLQRR